MNTTLVAVIIVVLAGTGMYLATSGLLQQFSVDTSGSRASEVSCAPDAAQVSVGALVRFSASGVPSGSIAYWSSPDGASQELADGRLQVRFGTAGERSVHLFYGAGDRWSRISCAVTVAP
jgi:hypothetical protein